ncbi:MAG TPA: AI-2E family transporter [Rhodanobacteraceae bacterium]|mgnify:FL=1|nr:AI-2E family transporter [Rhodanobacteraceae bacterium]
MTSTERWQWLVLVLLLGGLLYLLAPVLTPFATAALLAYLGDPLVDRLERWRLSRDAAVSVVFAGWLLLLVGVLLLLVPFTERQISNFLAQLPHWIEWFQTTAAPWLAEHLDISLDVPDTQRLIGMLQTHWKEAGGVAATVVAHVSKSGFAIVAWLMHLVVIPVVTFYLLRDWDVLVARVHELLPRKIEPTVARLARDSDEVLGHFLRGQLSVMLVLGLLYAVGLRLVGIDVGPLIGMIAGLISFVPYLGAIVGVGMGVVAALVQHHDWLHVLLVLGVFGAGHLVEGYVLVPKLIGDKIGLHPVAVIFAILAGGELFGFLGVLLALPVAAVVMVVLRWLHERYTTSALYAAGHGQVDADAPSAAAAPAEAVPAAGAPDPASGD